MDYDLYHDESKESGYWHGMLLVPRGKRELFLNCLKDVRRISKYDSPVGIKDLDAKGTKFHCIRSWILLGVASLMQNFKNDPYIVSIHDSKEYSKGLGVRSKYREIYKIDAQDKIIGAKFILFRDRDNHKKMGEGYPDHASKIETTCRMGLKGGIHWLGDDENPINIKSIHFDGHEHLLRNIDKDRIIGRINGLRGYCSIEENIDDRTSNHTKKDCQEYEDCQFLQLTDALVGGFRTILGEEKNKIQREVSLPVKKELVDKWQQGQPRMKNSRWYKGFWISESWIEGDNWSFGDFSANINHKQGVLLG